MFVLSPKNQICFPPYRPDLTVERLACGEEMRNLPPTPFRVLRYLAERPSRFVSKDELLQEIWPHVHVGEQVLKVAVSKIRTALSDRYRQPRFIETSQRRGYRFIGAVETALVVAEPAAMAATAAEG